MARAFLLTWIVSDAAMPEDQQRPAGVIGTAVLNSLPHQPPVRRIAL